ncbi:DUF3267 domain-containing protein [Myroides odoratimimus]|uniref:DUF3267 domain-containing protein n=1 Tax=Myroides odoratimimus TaxID=76832 RepID=UPI00024618F5|nr:DUF3267 domain-containing protein [Myroides odoratimimus]EHO08279.1 hypothetical protein HMPREF9714_02302 [Myroides odoratimimus CCUG 12901]MDM1414215.1 DUF3267 domain-containing protein [Myroides odoratimimus]MDM1446460.1 DUF3267 domain-containing protein [Myroides odoratimimus]MDM1506632.1 DUF3267 domain-containing protein [Myroides odoratimimus]MDM1526150.1 DUF3267 domain-containing protein [Myroides odoratimimus]
MEENTTTPIQLPKPEGFEDYTIEKKTIDLGKANGYALLSLIPIAIVNFAGYYLVWGEIISISKLKGLHPLLVMGYCFLYIVVMTLGIVVHELIHGATWAIFAKKGFKSIKLGFLKEYLTPYCHCKEPLKVRPYSIGAIMPAIILGFIPSILAIWTGSLGMLLFGIFFTVSAMGDFMIIYLIYKEDKDTWVQDHPSEAGYYLLKQ